MALTPLNFGREAKVRTGAPVRLVDLTLPTVLDGRAADPELWDAFPPWSRSWRCTCIAPEDLLYPVAFTFFESDESGIARVSVARYPHGTFYRQLRGSTIRVDCELLSGVGEQTVAASIVPGELVDDFQSDGDPFRIVGAGASLVVQVPVGADRMFLWTEDLNAFPNPPMLEFANDAAGPFVTGIPAVTIAQQGIAGGTPHAVNPLPFELPGFARYVRLRNPAGNPGIFNVAFKWGARR